MSEKLIEEIMFRYLELCVDLKKSHVAKEGLFQYRNMCQSTNVASLASVVQVILTYISTLCISLCPLLLGLLSSHKKFPYCIALERQYWMLLTVLSSDTESVLK